MAERAVAGGRYELGGAIGAGAFATVFRARDRQGGGEVAVKLVPKSFGAENAATRLWGEAAALKSVASRFVVRVLDVGEDESAAWLVMDLVDGVALAPEALGRALFPHEVLRVARGVLEGLAAVHAVGLVHGDVKPANIVVPRTKEALDAPKLIDFGASRPRDGEASLTYGTALWVAPEIHRGAVPDARADVYSVGLVLFELLGDGALFPGESTRAQIDARLAGDPMLHGRVPPPLSTVLAKMLARDPDERYGDASVALAAIVDLDTAPVAVTAAAETTPSLPPDSRRSSLPLASLPPPSLRPPASSQRMPGTTKLSTLPGEGVTGLRETLRHLDLPMLDALARRERGGTVGRVARAVALALRLELDAAALILEPLAPTSDVARAVGATLLAPRARRVTRARVDSDREDTWIDTVPAELAALLVALATALSSRDEAARDALRAARVLERLDHEIQGKPEDDVRRIDMMRVTLRIAHAAARVRRGELDPGVAQDLVKPLEHGDRQKTPFDGIVRPLLAASTYLRIDSTRARDELERAARVAAESGATLLEACADATWGQLLIETPARLAKGLEVLERASTLLAHGDAPTLEHEAEHYRAVALVVQKRWHEAIPHLRRARDAAHGERAVEREVLSASLEVVAQLCLGDRVLAHEAADALGDARLASVGGRAAALAWVAKSLDALSIDDQSGADGALIEARARAGEAGTEGADAFVVVEVLGLLYDAARGELPDVDSAASELEHFAEERGFASFHWFETLGGVLAHLEEGHARAAMTDALGRVTLVLGPSSRLARERRNGNGKGNGNDIPPAL